MQSVASRFLFSRLHYPMKPVLLALMFLSEEHRAQMAQSFELVYAPDAAQAAAAIAEHGARITVVLTIGATGLSAAQIDALPALTLICALGAGYENIAVAHAKARGVVVATGAGTNDDCVADHTWGLLIAAQRRILPLDKATRAGIWRTALPLPPNVSHKRLGIIGLGTIGKKIPQRAHRCAVPLLWRCKGAGRMVGLPRGRHARWRGHQAPGQRRRAECPGRARRGGQHRARQRDRYRRPGRRAGRRPHCGSRPGCVRERARAPG